MNLELAPPAGARTDRHPVRSGQRAAAETGTKTPPSSEALAGGIAMPVSTTTPDQTLHSNTWR